VERLQADEGQGTTPNFPERTHGQKKRAFRAWRMQRQARQSQTCGKNATRDFAALGCMLRLTKHRKRTIGNPMSEQATFTLGEAAKAVHRSKSTLSKAIKSGRLSCMSREGGEYQIAAAELYRVFPANSNSNGEIERLETLEETGRTAVLQAQLEGVQGELEQVKGERDDLRRRLDAEAEERRKLTALLTDQRPKAEAPALNAGRGFWARLSRRSR